MVNGFGVDPRTGYARNPLDNVGVQYGLQALNDGTITMDQFIDLNTHIGGMDANGRIVAQRQVGDEQALKAAYETGRIVEFTGGVKDVPAIAVRSYNDQDPLGRGDPNVDVHDGYHTNVVLARLLKYTGTRDNYVQFIATTLGTPQLDAQVAGSPGNVANDLALTDIDKWILAIQADPSSRTAAAEKVIADKPAGLVDTCWPTKESAIMFQTEAITDWPKCQQLFPFFGDARLAAGGPLTDDILKCQLKPVDPADYKTAPTADQLAALQKVFPTGVCDYGKRRACSRPPRSSPGRTTPASAPTLRCRRSSSASNQPPATGPAPPPILPARASAGIVARSTATPRSARSKDLDLDLKSPSTCPCAPAAPLHSRAAGDVPIL